MLAPDGRCKTLDAAANGYVRSEAVGLLALRLLSSVPTATRRSSLGAHRISGEAPASGALAAGMVVDAQDPNASVG